MLVLFIILGLIVLLLAVILIRTAMFKPKDKGEKTFEEVEFDREKVVSNLQKLVRCKTVSRASHDLEDEAEFQKLIDLLPELYPNVYGTCTLTKMEDRGLLYCWKGKNQGNPAVLMAHYDVVPVVEENWTKPAFEGLIEDGILWGRGSVDTKISFNGVLSAADHLIAEGFTPENDIYFAFSGGEEVNGDGAVHIVDWFEKNGITPELVVDEGGAVVENMFPGVTVPCGLIGIAEKGMMNIRYDVKSSGGHASAPAPHTPVGVLSMACSKVEAHPFKMHITKPVAEMFDTLGRHSNFVYRMIFANLWCFKGVLNGICKKSGGTMNALMRTTVAFTQMQGSDASNVIPPSASMVSNIRLNPEDTLDSALSYIKKVIGDDNVDVSMMMGMNPSRISDTDCIGWKRVTAAVEGTWQGCITAPYLMVQCSDSRHYGRISDRVYRFSAADLKDDERSSIHGNDEHIRVEAVKHAAEFYIRLMKMC